MVGSIQMHHAGLIHLIGTAPIVLGVTLAPIADENLRGALSPVADGPPGCVSTRHAGSIVVAANFLEGVLRRCATRAS
jgi:hypothetical protein